MEIETICRFLEKHQVSFFYVGSRVTCYPPPMDTDKDILCLVSEDKWATLKEDLDLLGFSIGGSVVLDKLSCPKKNEFTSVKLDELNLIITTDEVFFERFLLATRVSTKLNLLKKEDRITLFQAILYGNG